MLCIYLPICSVYNQCSSSACFLVMAFLFCTVVLSLFERCVNRPRSFYAPAIRRMVEGHEVLPLSVRPSVIKIWCPLNNFWKTASFQLRFGSWYIISKHRSGSIWVTIHNFLTELWAFYKNIAHLAGASYGHISSFISTFKILSYF